MKKIFIYVGPDEKSGPATGECFTANDIGHMLDKGIRKIHQFVELNEEEAAEINKLYEKFNEMFYAWEAKYGKHLEDRKITKRLAEEAGIYEFAEKMKNKGVDVK